MLSYVMLANTGKIYLIFRKINREYNMHYKGSKNSLLI